MTISSIASRHLSGCLYLATSPGCCYLFLLVCFVDRRVPKEEHIQGAAIDNPYLSLLILMKFCITYGDSKQKYLFYKAERVGSGIREPTNINKKSL